MSRSIYFKLIHSVYIMTSYSRSNYLKKNGFEACVSVFSYRLDTHLFISLRFFLSYRSYFCTIFFLTLNSVIVQFYSLHFSM